MALLYQADLQPTKLELLDVWLPTRSWYKGPAAPNVERVASFRFDDPDGEVGIETILVRVDDGALLQTPLTYRSAPLESGDEWFVGNTQHSVLGQRWVYDACGDPVYASVLATTILAGAAQAEEFIQTDGGLVRREPSVSIVSSGARTDVPTVGAVIRVDEGHPTRIVTGSVELVVLRVLGGTIAPSTKSETLTATWSGQDSPVLLPYAESI